MDEFYAIFVSTDMCQCPQDGALFIHGCLLSKECLLVFFDEAFPCDEVCTGRCLDELAEQVHGHFNLLVFLGQDLYFVDYLCQLCFGVACKVEVDAVAYDLETGSVTVADVGHDPARLQSFLTQFINELTAQLQTARNIVTSRNARLTQP